MLEFSESVSEYSLLVLRPRKSFLLARQIEYEDDDEDEPKLRHSIYGRVYLAKERIRYFPASIPAPP